jgi:hypothetical protein
MEVAAMRLTNAGEVVAFVLARVLTYGVMFFVSPVLLLPFYMQLMHSGGRELIMVVSESVSVVVWLVTLLLFLLFRAGFGAVPEIVAPPDRRGAVVSSGGEFGAFLLSMVIDLSAVTALNIWMLPRVYASFPAASRATSIMTVSLAVSIVSAVVLFLIFIALRAAMSRPASARPAP